MELIHSFSWGQSYCILSFTQKIFIECLPYLRGSGPLCSNGDKQRDEYNRAGKCPLGQVQGAVKAQSPAFTLVLQGEGKVVRKGLLEGATSKWKSEGQVGISQTYKAREALEGEAGLLSKGPDHMGPS